MLYVGSVTSGATTTGGSCSTTIADDFSGTLGKWADLGDGDWRIASGELESRDPGVTLYTPEQTCTLTQWGMMKYSNSSADAYAGFYLRSENNESTYAYAVRFEDASANQFAWRYCGGADNSNTAATCQTIAIWERILDLEDYFGVDITGTGTDTVVT